MKCIREKDDCWHPIENEMPPTTTKVQVRDRNGKVYSNREIVIDMSGFYLYSQEEGWESFDDYVEWRFDT